MIQAMAANGQAIDSQRVKPLKLRKWPCRHTDSVAA
jgi:hypothetical protein